MKFTAAFAAANSTRRSPLLRSLLEWGLSFFAFLAAIWLATLSRDAPQLVLLTLLVLIATNFSVPLASSIVSPILPIVTITALLVVGPPRALGVLSAGFLLAELSRPLWRPLWQHSPRSTGPLRTRLVRAVGHVAILSLASILYQQLGGQAPLHTVTLVNDGEILSRLVALSTVYAALFFLLNFMFARLYATPGKRGDALILLLMISALTQPFALFGAITHSTIGLPALVIFSVGAGAFAIIGWLAWQRHFTLNRQLQQFAALNQVGASLRESLDLPTVLQRTYRQVSALIDADAFTIILRQNNTNSYQIINISGSEPQVETRTEIDDFTAWVLQRGQVLQVDEDNIHFAHRHGLVAPEPQPAAWLGVPLTTSYETTGALVLQRQQPGQPFGPWNREVLLAIAGQASATIENARLYQETVRLYNQTDQALAERLKQLQALLNSTSEGVLMLDRHGCVALLNPPAAHFLNSDAQHLLQQPLQPETHAAALGYEPAALHEVLYLLQHRPQTLAEDERFADRSEVFTTRRSDLPSDQPQRRFLQRNEAPVVGDDGQLLGWLIILRDVTEEQERLEWRTTVTRMIVHDLRNPVTTLMTSVDLADAALGSDQPVRRHLRQARFGADEMLNMIDSLMDMTRLEVGQLMLESEALHLFPLVESVIERLSPLAQQRQVSLSCHAGTELPAVWADESLTRRIVLNLLDNALKFTPAGGRIWVHARPDAPLPGHEPGICCEVGDTGPGIAEEDRQRIFDRFTRVNSGGGQVRGTGLGLAFCKLAVEAQGGTIWVEEGLEQGSRFFFTIPGIPLFDDPPAG
jgi:signal transduction histidine kinase